MNGRGVLTIVLVGFAVTLGGCASRLVKEGFGAARGAKGSWTVLSPVAAAADRPLGAYRRFELAVPADGMMGKAPDQVISLLPGRFYHHLQRVGIANAAAGRTLRIRATIIHYESSSLAGQALGPLEEVVARVEFVDAAGGEVIAVVNCVGRTKESVNLGVEKKADGLAKAIVGWIDKRYPEDKRVKKD